VYLKLTVVDDVLVVSFKELWRKESPMTVPVTTSNENGRERE